MKTISCILIFLLGSCLVMAAETEKIKIEKTIRFPSATPDNILEIYNINGSLDVEGYDGQEVVVVVELTISAKTQAQLHKGKGELTLGVLEDDSAIVLYNKAPFIHTERIDGKCQCNWSDNPGYDFSFDFKVKVPKTTRLHIQTINEGFIEVKGMNSDVWAHHVNGPITLTRIGGSVDAKTINGDLTVEHTVVPKGGNSYFSFNGDVNVYYPAEPDAEITFKSFNGQFFTDLEKIEVMAPAWIKSEIKKNGGTSYKLSQEQKIKVGKGGDLLAFETFNGNIYVKKSK